MNMAEQHHLLRGELRERESMVRHTSWRAGGVVDRAYAPADLEDLRAFLATQTPEEPISFVGLGSNLLVRDGGWRGTVIFTQNALKLLRIEGDALYAEAGVANPKVARLAAHHGFSGAEFLAGIPGTVGGALAMNAGCHGGETWEIVEYALTLDRSGQLHTRTAADYDIAYRSVVPKAPRQEWFVAARFKLPRGDGEQSLATIKQLLERRMATQPLDLPNAGSVFRNPPNDHAARLIEACGLKGHVIGGAAISVKHANFIVNQGNASAADIEALMALMANSVREKFGVVLEREVRIIGEA
jgi:UDP-N-acetylmuramate dehydrogenase